MFGSDRRDVTPSRLPFTHPTDTVSGWSPHDENADFVDGALVIDAFDGITGVKVWHGSSRANVNPGTDDPHLQSDVRELLDAVPRSSVSAQGLP
jgi:hypothetical protein